MVKYMRAHPPPATAYDRSFVCGQFDRIMTNAARKLLYDPWLLAQAELTSEPLPLLSVLERELGAVLSEYKYSYLKYDQDPYIKSQAKNERMQKQQRPQPKPPSTRDPHNCNWFLITSLLGNTRVVVEAPLLEVWSIKLFGSMDSKWLSNKVAAFDKELIHGSRTRTVPKAHLTVEDNAFAIYDEILYTVMDKVLGLQAYDPTLESICYMLKLKLEKVLTNCNRYHRDKSPLTYKPPLRPIQWFSARNSRHACWAALLKPNAQGVVRFVPPRSKPQAKFQHTMSVF